MTFRSMDVSLDGTGLRPTTVGLPGQGPRDHFFSQPPHQKSDSRSATLQARRRRSAQPTYVLLPDGGFANRRYIELGAGTTVVGRCKSSGIRDHHVSRRHVEVTVPEAGEEGSGEGYCRIKYIGRNCRVVLVGGILLNAHQEVSAPPGTRVILNFNNKGLPRYSYTLILAEDLPAVSAAMFSRRRPIVGKGCRGKAESGAKRQGRFRKEAEEKLQQERDEIISRLADLNFG